MRNLIYLYFIFMAAVFVSCERYDVFVEGEEIQVTDSTKTDTIVIENDTVYNLETEGFYLLNEGNMGGNKCTLDYFDNATGTYHLNIYADVNPNVVLGLGDVGNDLLIYGNKMYAVVNCSHKVEVMNAGTSEKITKIDIPNCRYAVGHGGYVYVSSYVAPVQVDPSAPRGEVVKVDTVSMNIVGRVTVGYQPEEMTIVDDKLYVANSGGYRVPDYDNTISVIDLGSFALEKTLTIEESENFLRLDSDKHGRLWVSSRGDYYGNVNSNLYVVDRETGRVIKDMEVAASDVWVDDDIAYVISTEYSKLTQKNEVTYAKIDMNSMEVIDRSIIKDGTDANIKVPYGIAVDPVSKDIYITDAKSYVVAGTVYCFDNNGMLKWSAKSGQIPAHFAFKMKKTMIVEHKNDNK